MEDWDSGLYHRVSGPQFAWGMEVLDRLPLAGHERVLDLGCGSGRLSAEIQARLPRGEVVAADVSPMMVRQAAGNLRKKADVVLASATALPFVHAFDVVFSTAALHWVLDQETMFAEVHGALRPGGRLHAQLGGGRNVERLHHRALAVMRQPRFAAFYGDWRDPWVFQSAEQAKARMDAAGFATSRAWLEERPTRLPSVTFFREFVAGIVLRPHLARLPDGALRDAFMDEVVRLAAADDPPFTLDYWRLNLEATA